MKITITIECSNETEAAQALQRLAGANDNIMVVGTPAIPANQLTTATPKSIRPNIDPGDSDITKIGAATKKSVLAGVGMDAYGPNYKGKHIEHLRLLWKRGEVGFDGSIFYKLEKP